uniref:Abhydrolase domain containing 17A, depalmitoylase n=1 Tax=Gorilla gorilla gorilla TaxID=9595 RepID=G3SBN5_GORGO
MNGLSLSELCCLFCCPPCPGRIAAKLAFLPPEATYSLVPEPEQGPRGAGTAPLGTLRASSGAPGRWKLHLTERADFQYSQRELDTIEVFPTKSARGNRVSCMYVRCVPGASFYIGLGSRLHCNIFSYDYSGYGASSGRPSERNLYADIDAAWQALRTRAGPLAPPWLWGPPSSATGRVTPAMATSELCLLGHLSCCHFVLQEPRPRAVRGRPEHAQGLHWGCVLFV